MLQGLPRHVTLVGDVVIDVTDGDIPIEGFVEVCVHALVEELLPAACLVCWSREDGNFSTNPKKI